MGIVYLIQPEKYLNSNVLKIGRSSKDDLSRPHNGYGKKYITIHTTKCKNEVITENLLKFYFKQKFKLVEGYEYFEGDMEEMEQTYLFIVLEFEKIAKNKILLPKNNENNEDKIPFIENTNNLNMEVYTKNTVENNDIIKNNNTMKNNDIIENNNTIENNNIIKTKEDIITIQNTEKLKKNNKKIKENIKMIQNTEKNEKPKLTESTCGFSLSPYQVLTDEIKIKIFNLKNHFLEWLNCYFVFDKKQNEKKIFDLDDFYKIFLNNFDKNLANYDFIKNYNDFKDFLLEIQVFKKNIISGGNLLYNIFYSKDCIRNLKFKNHYIEDYKIYEIKDYNFISNIVNDIFESSYAKIKQKEDIINNTPEYVKFLIKHKNYLVNKTIISSEFHEFYINNTKNEKDKISLTKFGKVIKNYVKYFRSSTNRHYIFPKTIEEFDNIIKTNNPEYYEHIMNIL